jgi:hypothetical protein
MVTMRAISVTALMVAAATASAQTASTQAAPTVPLVSVADGDSVRLYVFRAPPAARGFVVYSGRAPGQLTKLTAEPVRPVTNYLEVAGVLKEMTTGAMRAANVMDEASLLRALEADPVMAGLSMIVYPKVGDLLGRRWSGARPARDSVANYRVVFVDATGRELGGALDTRLTLRDVLPPAPTALTAAPEGLAVRVKWAFPTYRDPSASVRDSCCAISRGRRSSMITKQSRGAPIGTPCAASTSSDAKAPRARR